MAGQGFLLLRGAGAGGRVDALNIHDDLLYRTLTQSRVVDADDTAVAVACRAPALFDGTGIAAGCNLRLCRRVPVGLRTVLACDAAQITIVGKVFEVQTFGCNMIDLILIDAHCAADGQTAAAGKLRHISKLRIFYGTLVSSRDTAEDGSCSRKLYVGHRHAARDGALVQSADCAHLVFAAADECHRTAVCIIYTAVRDGTRIFRHDTAHIAGAGGDVAIVYTAGNRTFIYCGNTARRALVRADIVRAVHSPGNIAAAGSHYAARIAFGSAHQLHLTDQIGALIVKGSLIDSDDAAHAALSHNRKAAACGYHLAVLSAADTELTACLIDAHDAADAFAAAALYSSCRRIRGRVRQLNETAVASGYAARAIACRRHIGRACAVFDQTVCQVPGHNAAHTVLSGDGSALLCPAVFNGSRCVCFILICIILGLLRGPDIDGSDTAQVIQARVAKVAA